MPAADKWLTKADVDRMYELTHLLTNPRSPGVSPGEELGTLTKKLLERIERGINCYDADDIRAYPLRWVLFNHPSLNGDTDGDPDT